MKKLNTRDVFAFTRIIKASGMRNELIGIIQRLSTEDKKNVGKVGISTILTVIDALAEKNAENAIYEFLSKPFEMTPEQVAEMEIRTLTETLHQMAEDNDLTGFFKYVSGLLGKK